MDTKDTALRRQSGFRELGMHQELGVSLELVHRCAETLQKKQLNRMMMM